jgi:hypothetical protein
MTNTQKNEPSLADQLADFTDRILSDETLGQEEATFAPEPGLRALEQTAQRLKAAFAENEPDPTVIQKMRNNIIEQWRQQENHASESIWHTLTSRFVTPRQKWTSLQSRKRFNIAVSLATLVVLLLVAIPFMKISGTGLPGASGQNPSAFVLIALVGLILLALWLFRRKP